MAASTSSSPRADRSPHVVILAGGVGTRFWPASTPRLPKQLLPLGVGPTLLEDTLERARSLAGADRIHLVTNRRVGERVRAAVPSLPAEAIWEEPVSAGTGPALAFAAWMIAQTEPRAVMISLHADHLISPPQDFETTLGVAQEIAEEGHLVLVGARPSRPDPGFGYLEPDPGRPLTQGGCAVRSFVEKPPAERAAGLIERGWLWNTGIFAWRVDRFLEEVERTAPQIHESLGALDRGDRRDFFESCPSISVDHAVLEHSLDVAVVPASFSWDDLGSWESVTRTRTPDSDGNFAIGPLHAVDGRGNVTYARGGAVALLGVEDLVVVHTPELTFVMPRERAAELRSFVESLPDALRDD